MMKLKKQLLALVTVVIAILASFPANAFALDWEQRSALVDAARDEVGTSYAMEPTPDYYYIYDDCKYGTWYAERSWWNYFNGGYYRHKAPWCAMFVGYCADKAGIGTDDIPPSSDVGTIASWYDARGKYRSLGAYQPEPGDLAFFANANGWTHMAIVTKYWEGARDQAGTYGIQLVEGDVVREDAEVTWRTCGVEETVHTGWLPYAAPTCEAGSTIVGFGVN